MKRHGMLLSYTTKICPENSAFGYWVGLFVSETLLLKCLLSQFQKVHTFNVIPEFTAILLLPGKVIHFTHTSVLDKKYATMYIDWLISVFMRKDL